jgi:hypothetical protein
VLYGLLLSFGALSAGIPVQPRLAVRAIRFYVPSAKQTQVVGFLQVPYALTEPAGNRIAWETTVAIKDAAGNPLGTQSWWSGRPASAREPDAVGMESLRFPPMMPGKYVIQVTVKDSVSGKVSTTETAMEAFASSPGVSDLLLASSMRKAAPGDTLLGAGEFSHGSYRFVTAPELQLDPINPVLSYLIEAYTDAETESSTVIDVQDAAGKSIYKLPASRQKIPAPMAGPTRCHPRAVSKAMFAAVGSAAYMSSFMAGAISTGLVVANKRAVSRSSAIPAAARAIKWAVAGATMTKSASCPSVT